MADEAGKEAPKETCSREYNALGRTLYEGLCKSHGLTEFQTRQLDKFMHETAGMPSTNPRYIKTRDQLLKTQVDPEPVIGAILSINIVYAELFSPHSPRARGKRGSN